MGFALLGGNWGAPIVWFGMPAGDCTSALDEGEYVGFGWTTPICCRRCEKSLVAVSGSMPLVRLAALDD